MQLILSLKRLKYKYNHFPLNYFINNQMGKDKKKNKKLVEEEIEPEVEAQ